MEPVDSERALLPFMCNSTGQIVWIAPVPFFAISRKPETNQSISHWNLFCFLVTYSLTGYRSFLPGYLDVCFGSIWVITAPKLVLLAGVSVISLANKEWLYHRLLNKFIAISSHTSLSESNEQRESWFGRVDSRNCMWQGWNWKVSRSIEARDSNINVWNCFTRIWSIFTSRSTPHYEVRNQKKNIILAGYSEKNRANTPADPIRKLVHKSKSDSLHYSSFVRIFLFSAWSTA